MFLVGSFSPHTCLTLCRLDAGNGLSYVTNVACKNVTWIGITSPGSFLCTNENAGTVSKVHIDSNGGHNYSLRYEASYRTEGMHPTHLAVYKDRVDCLQVVVANYSSGSVFLFRDEDGELRLIQVCQELPNSITPSHPHYCLFYPARSLLYVCDLGLNALFVYGLAESMVLLTTFSFPVGSGPRHAVLSVCGGRLYVACELSNQLAIIAVDATTGFPIGGSEQLYRTMPEDADMKDMAVSEILLSADGRFLYISNRDIRPVILADQAGGGQERSSIAVFGLLDGGARAQLLQCAGSRGRHPRHMALTREGSLLLVANKDTHNFATFPVDTITGQLDEAAVVVSICDSRCEEPAFLLKVSV